eukprot:360629-Chlamydomonas_euryale.AAC.4
MPLPCLNTACARASQIMEKMQQRLIGIALSVLRNHGALGAASKVWAAVCTAQWSSMNASTLAFCSALRVPAQPLAARTNAHATCAHKRAHKCARKMRAQHARTTCMPCCPPWWWTVRHTKAPPPLHPKQH